VRRLVGALKGDPKRRQVAALQTLVVG